MLKNAVTRCQPMPMDGMSASMRKNVQETRILRPAARVIAVCSVSSEAPLHTPASCEDTGEAHVLSIAPSAHSAERMVKKQATIAKIVASM
jgi:hypothetical protein